MTAALVILLMLLLTAACLGWARETHQHQQLRRAVADEARRQHAIAARVLADAENVTRLFPGDHQ